MQTWAILAAKHVALVSGTSFGAVPAPGWKSLEGVAVGLLLAGIGLAAVSARKVPSCPLTPSGGQISEARGGIPARGRMSRFRRRVDGVLTGMLSDHEHEQTSASSGGTAAGAAEDEEKRFAAPSAWHGGYVDALPSRPRRPDGEQLWPLGNRRPGAASKPDDGDRASAAAPGHDELRPLASPGQQLSDTFLWFIAAPVDDPHAVRDPGAE